MKNWILNNKLLIAGIIAGAVGGYSPFLETKNYFSS
jgi:hypothetical protein